MTDKITETVTIAAEEAGLRLDRVLAAHIATMSRSRLKALILAGQVKIAARTIRDPAASVNSGDTITVTLPPPEKALPEGEAIPLNVIYEDDAIIVIDKPKGLVVHPAAGHAAGTLVNALIAHCGASLSGIGGVKRPGIVHRLDKDTTGLMVVAKTDKAHRALSKQFAEKTEGTTQAWLPRFGLGRAEPPEGHNRCATRPPRLCARQAGGARERSPGRHSLARAGAFPWSRRQAGREPLGLHIRNGAHPPDPGASGSYRPPDSGRRDIRHRIQDQSPPIGAASAMPRWRVLGRQALHAYLLAIEHPETGDTLEFRSELPGDLRRLRDALHMEGREVAPEPRK